MTLRRAILIAAALSVAFGSAAPAEDGELPSNPFVGRQLFISKGCNQCHAIWGEGGSLGPDLGQVGVFHSVMELAGVLWNHSPQMIEKMRERHIARPGISPEEMGNLAAFLYFLNYFDPPGDAREGERLFSADGCVRCHRLGGQGGGVGPPLDGLAAFSSPLALAGAMWRHGPQMAERMKALDVARPKFTDREITHLFAYVRQAAPSTGRRYLAPGNPAAGRSVFEQKRCGTCHAVRGHGPKIGPDLGEIPLHEGLSEIVGRMWNHGPEMWKEMRSHGVEMPEFTDQELSDLIAYLHFVQYFDPPGNPSEGRVLFAAKGCITCHSAAGEGGTIAPDLSQSQAVSSPIEWASRMWNHAPAMEQLLKERELPWPRFAPGEMRDLVAYLRLGSTVGATPPLSATEQENKR
jgi:mono/diheme cytochrome c family protein